MKKKAIILSAVVIIGCFILILAFLLALEIKNKKTSVSDDSIYGYYVCEIPATLVGDCYIAINGNGTFEYSTGPLSSYIGLGSWTYDGKILTLITDIDARCCKFSFDGDSLIYIAEGSTETFIPLNVVDGTKFNRTAVEVQPQDSCSEM